MIKEVFLYEQKYLLKIKECEDALRFFKGSIIEASDVLNELILDGLNIDEISKARMKNKYFDLLKKEPLKVDLSFIEIYGDIGGKKKKINNVKTCYVCKDMLLEIEFGFTTRVSNGREEVQSYCRKCANEYGKNRWKEVNSKNDSFKEKSNLRRKNLYEEQKKDSEFVDYRRAISKKHYDIKNNDIEWRKKENERVRLYRLNKKKK